MARNERIVKTEAIILKHAEWGEADRIITLFSKEKGKLRAIAKGVRKLASRKAGHIEPFACTHLMLAAGRDFWLLTQAELINAFQTIRDDLVLTGYAAYACELVDRFTTEGEENRNVYKLLAESLERLAGSEDAFTTLRYFEIHLLDYLGYRPQLMTCVHCGREIIAEDQFFTAEKGGILCPRCRSQAGSVRAASMDVLRFMRHFQRSGFSQIKKVTLSSSTRHELEELLNYYLTYLLERKLNSPDFIKFVDR